MAASGLSGTGRSRRWYLYRGKPIDFDRWLGLAGLYLECERGAAKDGQDFQVVLRALHIGDTVRIEINGNDGKEDLIVRISGYSIPIIRVAEDGGASQRQRGLLRQWEEGR